MKTSERIFRERHLTPDEVATDQELRGKLEREFPPKSPDKITRADSLSGLLRRAIRESGRSFGEIAESIKVSPALIARFVSGERDIHMATADRLARSLGLEVTAE